MKRAAPLAICFLTAFASSNALAGFRSPQSLVQNLYAWYGDGSPDYSHGLPHDEATARTFFQPALARAWQTVVTTMPSFASSVRRPCE